MKKIQVLLLILISLFLTGQSHAQTQLRGGRILLDTDAVAQERSTQLSQVIGPGADKLFQSKGAAYSTNFPYTHPRSFRLTVEKTDLPLTLFPKRESDQHTRIAVSYPDGLYSIFIRTANPLSLLSQTEVVKETVCRKKKPFCTQTEAQDWQKGVYGIGYRVQGDHALPDFATPTYYRSLSNSTEVPFVSNMLNTTYIKSTSVYSSNLYIAVKLSENQPRGTYRGVIEVIGIPEY